ncbi:hypothetical protein DM02DRAFT_615710 [Periconia macrospinosa]|uniref:DUF6536 domain-containing protein n=1 Tax=Periconia macrospinosa TaxID=97972 RepID=A0A2V1DN71_9PLEO|nr:hypothetical protein DM02DRAFT_615710 [Periconia macrospinosa]
MRRFSKLRQIVPQRMVTSTFPSKRQQSDTGSSTELRALRQPSEYDVETTYQPRSTSKIDLLEAKSRPSSQSVKRWTSGWRFGATTGAGAVLIVFIINLVVTIWGTRLNPSDSSANGGLLYEGDCDRVDRLNSGIHILINVLSTVLLSASNYCMQCLSAPTRKDIDQAHAKRQWLDIGVPSLHNLRRISRKRALIWSLLGLTSLPLHLFYNSAVFSSISINNYMVLSVNESFLHDENCFNCSNITRKWGYEKSPIPEIWEKARNGGYERLSKAQCIEEYAQLLQSKRRNVLLVAADDRFPRLPLSMGNSTRIYAADIVFASNAADPGTVMDSYKWICPSAWSGGKKLYHNNSCAERVNEIKSAPDQWRVGETEADVRADTTEYNIEHEGYPIDYCLSERAEPHCTLEFVTPIAILVTILNLIKAALILYTVFGIKDEPLLTMGDAVASFLEREDLTTRDMCLLSVKEIKESKNYFPVGPRMWSAERWRWKDVASVRRRIATISIFVLTVVAVVALFVYGVQKLPRGTPRSLPGLVRLGFGSIDPRTVILFDHPMSIVGNAVVANIAQPILSFLYFTYNGLFTCMLLGHEWSTYAHNQKGLRVSRPPAGSQRSTYFLQLPYRFALPLMTLSSILHWLVSQSIFLVAIDVYDFNGAKYTMGVGGAGTIGGWKSCGYSPIAICSVFILGFFMVVAIIAFGFVPYKPGMNLAGSCSAAISAACHLGKGEVNGVQAAQERLQWGVVGTNEEGVGHCAFSTKEVRFPIPSEMYAGCVHRRS